MRKHWINIGKIKLFLVLAGLLFGSTQTVLAKPFSPKKSSFKVKAKGEEFDYSVQGLFVLPGQTVTFSIFEGAQPTDSYAVITPTGSIKVVSERKVSWTAPKKVGLYPIVIQAGRSGAKMTFNTFVMRPISEVKKGRLNGYKIGHYPKHKRNSPYFAAPKGFIEVTKENQNTWVAPHFTLKQFLCKQQPKHFPKYVALKESLLRKLEVVLADANKRGYKCDTLFIMSGFRTPYYNRRLGSAKFSQHQYGSAADIFIDAHPRNGIMDELNGDKRIDKRDADVLYRLVEKIDHHHKATKLRPGGIGQYGPNRYRGPFVHVDVRGYKARWGT